MTNDNIPDHLRVRRQLRDKDKNGTWRLRALLCILRRGTSTETGRKVLTDAIEHEAAKLSAVNGTQGPTGRNG